MKKQALFSAMAVATFALSACGGKLDSTAVSAPAPQVTTVIATAEAPQSSAPATEQVSNEAAQTASASATTSSAPTPIVQEETSAASASSTSAEQCGNKSAEQAVADNIHKVPEYFPGDDKSPYNNHPGSSWISETNYSDFDACADLSWVLLHTSGASAAIPYQMMLFHKGEYIGTPAKVSFAFAPKVSRISDDQIEVGYRWAESGESNAEAQIRATSTFTYNPSTGGVDHGGQWPKSEIIRADGTLPIDDYLDRGVARRAGGDIPGDAYEAKLFQTPSGNIICAIGGSDPTCWELSNDQTIQLGGYDEAPDISDGLHGIGNGEMPTADYGSTVYGASGTACAVEENGVTCWNNYTGHGAFISKQDTFTF